jgi:hypothetical protein
VAITFPAALDSLTNPAAGNPQNSPSHSQQHSDANDAIEALEAKVGIDGSAVTTSHDYKIRFLEAGKVNVTTRTANYTLTDTDGVIFADATSGAITLTLPTAVGRSGKVFVLKRINTNNNDVTIALTGGQTLDQFTTYPLVNPYDAVRVVSTGSAWAAF